MFDIESETVIMNNIRTHFKGNDISIAPIEYIEKC